MKKLLSTLTLLLMAGTCAFAAAPAKPAAKPAAGPKISDVYATHGLVSSAHELASRAGAEILKKGGNAIDAAVATAFALHVAEFNTSGLGGGGYMIIRDAKTKKVVCLDYREQAPNSATKDLFSSQEAQKMKWSTVGGKAIGVPGWLKGMEYALKTYGTMKLADVLAPAIKLAEDGFVLDKAQHEIIIEAYTMIMRYNKPDQVPMLVDALPMEAGHVLKQPKLAATLKLIAAKGSDVYYHGEVGEVVVRAVNKAGGKMTMEDLNNYKMHVRIPAEGTYRGYHIYSMPPSSSGGTHVIQLLNIMENFDVKKMGHNTPEFAHTWGEATKLVFADRGKYMADSDFVKLPLKGIQSKEYAKVLAKRITSDIVLKPEAGDPWKFEPAEKKTSALVGDVPERMSTTSFSVVDAKGNIVTSTNTINDFCGCGVMVPEYGFFLNDEMDDFSSNAASVNAPEPTKRPLSSMSPSIVLDPKGNPFMSIGSAGGPRIITAICQIIMNTIDYGMTMDQAIEQCRIHNQSGKDVYVDGDRYDQKLVDALKAAGYNVKMGDRYYLGGAQGIMFDKKGRMDGGADSRRLGVPVGF